MSKPQKKEKKTTLDAIVLIVICTIFTSFGQIFWKFSTKNMQFSITSLIMNYWLWLGFLSYFIGAVIMLVALKKGELSVLYPFIALSFIWVALISMLLLEESLHVLNWLGIILIIIGVSFIGRGSS